MSAVYTVLILPAGSGMAVAAIQILKRDKNLKIISVDSDKLSPGLYLSNKGYVVPTFDNNAFYPTIEKIIKKEKVDVIIPALDTILLDFSKRRRMLESLGAKVLISEPETIAVTRDKWKTYKKLNESVPFPKSYSKMNQIDVDFPLIIKPRTGSGSKDVYKVINNEELTFYYKRVNKPIIQEYLEGKEYTIDCLCDMNGKLLTCIPRERISTKAGISIKSRITKNQKLVNIAKKISKHIKFKGPFFFQAKEDKNGEPKLTEINPRISGTMSLSSYSGQNIHNLAVKICMGEKIHIGEIKYGTYLSRYWKDIYLIEEDMKKSFKNISKMK